MAYADWIPALEILASDVRCTHGSTAGHVDREQLFYLMTRGLTRQEAERIIVRGFLHDILDGINLEPLPDALATALKSRMRRPSDMPRGLRAFRPEEPRFDVLRNFSCLRRTTIVEVRSEFAFCRPDAPDAC
jgi:hypothetical protein